MIAITSDFGSGKSSLISLLEKRIEKIKYNKVLCFRKKYKLYKINMWNVLNNNSDTTSIELHKSFVYNLSSQMSRRKGSYISKRLSKNYGLFKIDTGRISTKILFFIALLFFLFVFLSAIFQLQPLMYIYNCIITAQFSNYNSVTK